MTTERASLIFTARDLTEWMRLPCLDNPTRCTSLEAWQPRLYRVFDDSLYNAWRKYSLQYDLALSLLFNYWIYYQKWGKHLFQTRSLDGVINTNRYYQIWQGLQQLDAGRVHAQEWVWEQRLEVLQQYPSLPVPESREDLEACLTHAFLQCQHRMNQ